MSEPEKVWKCNRCLGTFGHSECATRFGMVECPSCICMAFVGLLVLVEPTPKEPSRE